MFCECCAKPTELILMDQQLQHCPWTVNISPTSVVLIYSLCNHVAVLFHMTVGNNDLLAPKVDYSQHMLCGQNSWSQIKMLQKTCKVMADIFQAVQSTPCILFQPQRIDHMTVFPSDRHFVLVGLGMWSLGGNRTEGRKGKLSLWLSIGRSVASV
jgi:hypothetical protein